MASVIQLPCLCKDIHRSTMIYCIRCSTSTCTLALTDLDFMSRWPFVGYHHPELNRRCWGAYSRDILVTWRVGLKGWYFPMAIQQRRVKRCAVGRQRLTSTSQNVWRRCTASFHLHFDPHSLWKTILFSITQWNRAAQFDNEFIHYAHTFTIYM